jgi:hypothetical protein
LEGRSKASSRLTRPHTLGNRLELATDVGHTRGRPVPVHRFRVGPEGGRQGGRPRPQNPRGPQLSMRITWERSFELLWRGQTFFLKIFIACGSVFR